MSKTKRTKAKTTKSTTTVDVVIRLEVAGSPSDVKKSKKYQRALACLADVMRVQAEDGLWTLGYEDGELDDVPNDYVADIERSNIHAILIKEGR